MLLTGTPLAASETPDYNRTTMIQGDANELEIYADLVGLYPDNDAYLRRYAELLRESGQIAMATEAWRQLHALLLRQGKTKQADELAREHPEIGRIAAAGDDATLADLLPETFRGRMWRMLHGKRLKEGEALFHEGDAGDSAWWLAEGELAVIARDPASGGATVLALIAPGDIVGEQALLEPGARTASVVANKKSLVIELPRREMLKAMVENPGLQAELQRRADFRHMIQLVSRNPLLRGIPMDMRQHIARETTVHRHAAGELIHRAGEIVHHVSMLVRGRAAWIWEAGGKRVKLDDLAIGEFAGDTSAVREATMPAHLLAVSEATMARIPLACFKTVVEGYPPLREALFRHAENERERLMRRISRLSAG